MISAGCLGYPFTRTIRSSAIKSVPARQIPNPYLSIHTRSVSNTSIPFQSGYLSSPTDHLQAQSWIDAFRKRGASAIPSNGYEISMTRSSGPGGQNVNKLSTKAVLRMAIPPPADPAGKAWLPAFVLPPLKASSYYTSSPPSLLLTSSLSRSASQNRSSAIEKLHTLIVDSAQSCIITPTSEEQKEKVKGLMRAEEGRRREMKSKRGTKKAGRSKGNWD